MADEKIIIMITPTPAVQDISKTDLLRLSRITKLTPEKLSRRISTGKSIAIVTSTHPKLEEVANLLRGIGFSVTMSPAEDHKAPPLPLPISSAATVVEESEWKVGDVIENLYEVRDIKYRRNGSRLSGSPPPLGHYDGGQVSASQVARN